jgi:hypothetical protein
MSQSIISWLMWHKIEPFHVLHKSNVYKLIYYDHATSSNIGTIVEACFPTLQLSLNLFSHIDKLTQINVEALYSLSQWYNKFPHVLCKVNWGCCIISRYGEERLLELLLVDVVRNMINCSLLSFINSSSL